MSKNSTKTTLKISCETADVKAAIANFFLNYSGNVEKFITGYLDHYKIKSDTKIVIQGDEIIIKQKSGEKSNIFLAGADGLLPVKHKDVPDFDRYMELRDGQVILYLKMPDNIDVAIAGFKSFEDVIRNINTNAINEQVQSVIDTYKASIEPKQEEVTVGEDAN